MKLGQPLALDAPSYPGTDYSPTTKRILTFGHESFSMSGVLSGFGSTVLANSTWFAVNCPVAYPWAVNEPTLVCQLGWQNGSAAGGNHDVGIYDTSWNRLISTGSTAGVTNNALQFVDVTDTLIVPGYYYVVEAMDDVTANRQSGYANAVALTALLALAGVMDSATAAFPLPNPLTNMVTAATVSRPDPIFVATRALV